MIELTGTKAIVFIAILVAIWILLTIAVVYVALLVSIYTLDRIRLRAQRRILDNDYKDLAQRITELPDRKVIDPNRIHEELFGED